MVKNLKNFTTSIPIDKTIMEIEQILQRMGVSRVFKMYNDGKITALAFAIIRDGKELPFKLPMQDDKILVAFQNAVRKGNLPKRYMVDKEQASRTGWRIIKDWVDSQMALIEINTVKVEEVFLPYLFNPIENKTLFEIMEAKKFDMQIEYKKEDNNG